MPVKKNRKRKANIPNIVLTVIAIAFLLILIYGFHYNITDDMLLDNPLSVSENNISNDNQLDYTKVDFKKTEVSPDVTIKLTSVGDIMCHNTQYQDAYVKSSDSYDFSNVFSNIADNLRSADLTIGNLETTFAGKDRGYSGYPTFNTPDELATNLKELGFDVLSTANNHSLDKGYSGVERTIEVLDTTQISHMGTYNSEEAQNQILIKDVKGIKIAFLSYTYGTNGIPIPSGKEYCINLIDKDKIKQDLNKSKELGAELICVSMHWGEEYRLKPTENQKDLANFLFNNGADIVLGNHPHVLEPMETREITLEDGTTKPCFVIYSHGNFVSGQVKQYTNHSIILNLTITKHGDTGKFTIDDVNYIPIYVDNRGSNSSERYKLLDINKSISAYENKTDSSISKTLYDKLVAARDSTDKILKGDV